jgi:cell division protein FtsI/penicillin-binding protein 2
MNLTQLPNWRLGALCLTMLLLLGGLGTRLFSLQVLNHPYYQALAASQRERAAELAPHRGVIYASEEGSEDVFPLAVNKETWTAYAVPRDMKDPLSVAKELAPLLYGYQQRRQARLHAIMTSTGQGSPTNPVSDSNSEEEKNALDILTSQLYAKFNQKTDPYEPFLRPYEVLDSDFKVALEQKQLPGLVLAARETSFYT